MYYENIAEANVTNCVLHAISDSERYRSRIRAFGMVGIKVHTPYKTHSVDGSNL